MGLTRPIRTPKLCNFTASDFDFPTKAISFESSRSLNHFPTQCDDEDRLTKIEKDSDGNII